MNYAEFALIRFGSGLSPRHQGPESADALLDSLRVDGGRRNFPALDTDTASGVLRAFEIANRDEQKTPDGPAIREQAADRLNQIVNDAIRARFARAVDDPTGFADRLVQFWASHFSIRAGGPHLRILGAAFQEDAIRARLTGRFADMLGAATMHPAMLMYLDQAGSIGPRSNFARNNADRREFGLNENHARELLELHTMGVGGSYDQTDVRQLAKLMTGLGLDSERRFVYRPNRAEPGAETVLGRAYGGGRPPKLAEVTAFFDDIAVHPDTAAHIARKLAVHFCADDPPADLIGDLAARFRETGGDLMAVYDVLVRHPAAVLSFGQKVRQPLDYITASLRALGLSGAEIIAWQANELHAGALAPMQRMGQPVLGAPQPEGWPEAADAWLGPQLLAARIDFAMRQPKRLRDPLPDPRDFVQVALGTRAAAVAGAVARAESLSDGVGLVLASPQFNRR
ncbi:MAG: DUF1800 domain-containing protein [Paracoccus sp. (in: a-proteobacteria)]|nr:DUF1800 domain-containing protein [Paracoccus sp. (in: a-proteobacteria)]